MGESICKTLDTKRNPEHIENAYNSESISLRRQQAKELKRSFPSDNARMVREPKRLGIIGPQGNTD